MSAWDITGATLAGAMLGWAVVSVRYGNEDSRNGNIGLGIIFFGWFMFCAARLAGAHL